MACSDVDTFDRAAQDGKGSPRPYIGIHFECCGVYARVYRRHDQTTYAGRCPRCLRPVRVRVGPDGTNTRLFRAR